MDVFEILCIFKDENDRISHCGVKGYGIQSIEIIEKLISEDTCSFFVYKGESKKKVYTKSSKDGTRFLTIDANGFDLDSLNFLPTADKPIVRQILESAR